MDKKFLNQIKNAEIDIQPYDPSSRALPTIEDVNQRRESLLKSGLINPIIITEDENNVPQIVDGNLRYTLIHELKKKKQWSTFPISVVVIPLGKAKSYRDIQTNHKNYTKFQLAIFGAYNYWDEVEKNSLLRQQQGKKASGKKGKTSEIVGDMSGVNEKYAQYAHELLEIDVEFFYNIFFIKRYSLKKAEIGELLAAKNDEKLIKEIIDEMKNIADKNKQPLHGSIYAKAKSIVAGKHKPAYERLIRKQTASDTEAEEIKNALFAKANESDSAIFANSNIIEFNEVTKKLNVANSTVESLETEIFSPNKTLCIITSSQPLPEFISSHLKQYIENNSNYIVEIQQIYDTEKI